DEAHGDSLAELEGVQKDGHGYRAEIRYERPLRSEQEYEIRVPLTFSDGKGGRLSLFRRPSGSRLFTDVRLVAQVLAPAIAAALERAPAAAKASEDAAEAGR
ncbi:MAG: hypothetical protein R3253_14265, partial [Longimicrobiales bacterium]|nr:hypothetical protein [Longimicrobiales bacterium]